MESEVYSVSESKRIVVFVPDSLLEEVDGICREYNSDRNQFIREAVRVYVQQKKKGRRLRIRLEQGYKQMARINLEMAEEYCETDYLTMETYERSLPHVSSKKEMD